MGDVLELKEYGVSDLSTAVLEALKSPVTAPELEALRTEVDNLDDAVVGILTVASSVCRSFVPLIL